MTQLATIYPAYSSMDFDLEAATETLKRLVITWEQAVEWAGEEITEGREIKLDEWAYEEFVKGPRRLAIFSIECNEYGTPEEWLLFMEDVPFWAPKGE